LRWWAGVAGVGGRLGVGAVATDVWCCVCSDALRLQ